MSSSKDKEENNHEFEEFEAYYHTGYLFEIVRQLLEKLKNASEDEQRHLAILGTVTAVMACEAFINELAFIAANSFHNLPESLRQLGLLWPMIDRNLSLPEKYEAVWRALNKPLRESASHKEFQTLIELRNSIIHSRTVKVVWEEGKPKLSHSGLEELLKKLEDRKLYASPAGPPVNKYPTKGGLTSAVLSIDPSRSWLWSLQPKELVEWAFKTANNIVNETIDLLPNESREGVKRKLLEPKTPSPHIRTKANAAVIARPKPDS